MSRALAGVPEITLEASLALCMCSNASRTGTSVRIPMCALTITSGSAENVEHSSSK